MKLSILSHASMLLEHDNISLLTDPWLTGSCYWRSWWNFPLVAEDVCKHLRPTHIYISHLHWDHYHLPTLRRICSHNPTILLPKSFSPRIINDLRELKCELVELTHAKSYSLAPNFKVISFQVNPLFIDSALVIKCGSTSVLNLNDCKPVGLSANHLRALCRRPTFLLRSYASASPIPLCIKHVNHQFRQKHIKPLDLRLKYMNSFIKAINFFNPQYAVPFASNHIFGRPDTYQFNDFGVNPFDFNTLDGLNHFNSRIVPMPNGSSYTSFGNCFHVPFSPASFSTTSVDQCLQYKNRQALISAQISKEHSSRLNRHDASQYFNRFLALLPYPIRLVLPLNLIFYMTNSGESVRLDILARTIVFNDDTLDVNIERVRSSDRTLLIALPAAIFNDCNRRFMYNTLTPSKIPHFYISGSVRSKFHLLAFLAATDMYENSYFDTKIMLSFRTLFIILRRIPELLDYVLILPLLFLLRRLAYLLKLAQP